jgi:hypothetical protein
MKVFYTRIDPNTETSELIKFANANRSWVDIFSKTK